MNIGDLRKAIATLPSDRPVTLITPTGTGVLADVLTVAVLLEGGAQFCLLASKGCGVADEALSGFSIADVPEEGREQRRPSWLKW